MSPAFTQKLLAWNKKQNTRDMPWKGEKNPYRIWLSEIILQQTRVDQGWAYYERFIKTFPTVHDLAKAPQEQVFKLWEGLGYYNRCRNLIETAQIISRDYAGKFPSTYEQIRQLKGIGPYTAAAIASFAFDLPHAVVDGNVERVLARYFGEKTAIDTSAGKKFYTALATSLLDQRHPGNYNQAIMDFGAVICKPKLPLCEQCIQRNECQAFRDNKVAILPVKKKAAIKKDRWFTYIIVEFNGQYYIHRRESKDIWQNLYEFVLVETTALPTEKQVMGMAPLKKILQKQNGRVTTISPVYRQQLTHQNIHGRFIHVVVKHPIPFLKEFVLIKKDHLNEYPFPRFITRYFENLAAG
jgi:A/G-specific adenine glycosylase